MQRRDQFLQGFLDLHQLRDPREVRSVWRSSLASLARSCADGAPSPLEGLAPRALVASVKVALESGLVDQVDWLAPESAAAALYEIAAALPTCKEKRDLGRRTLVRLRDGEAATFVALATRMALGSGKGLRGQAMRARVGLVAALPYRYGMPVDRLAMSLLARRSLVREWATGYASGSLAERQLAARLLKHAARNVARRTAQGDDSGLRALSGPAITAVHESLLADREALVWRHAACARGLLAAFLPSVALEIEDGLGPKHTPTEWRRASTSAVAAIALNPDWGLKRVRDALAGGLLQRDPGAANALLFGVPAAAEVEPEAAEEVLELVVEHAPTAAAETFLEVVDLGPYADFGSGALKKLRRAFEDQPPSCRRVDDGAVAIRARIAAGLEVRSTREATLADGLREAIGAYVKEGAPTAYSKAKEALRYASDSMATLEALDESAGKGMAAGIARRASVGVLLDLDEGLFRDGTLLDLLALGAKASDFADVGRECDNVYHRACDWLIEREEGWPAAATGTSHAGLRLRRIQTLLHIADAARLEAASDEAPESLRHAPLDRASKIAHFAMTRLHEGLPNVLVRATCATLARAVDALIRQGGCDPTDIMLVLALRPIEIRGLNAVCEACMSPELEALLTALVNLLEGEGEEEEELSYTGPHALPTAAQLETLDWRELGDRAKALAPLHVFADRIDAGSSARTGALRNGIQRVVRTLVQVFRAKSLKEVHADDSSSIASLEASLAGLAQLCAGANQRFWLSEHAPESAGYSLAQILDARINGGDEGALQRDLEAYEAQLPLYLPEAFYKPVLGALAHLAGLPVRLRRAGLHASGNFEMPLPAWLPRRRTIGGFYVVRALGAGTGGTVFVVRRIEDRHRLNGERFALKVPDYDGNAARTLSEDEFMALFRAEASALLGLPAHDNLARFVTFDLAARPKPILVMELVEGITLERVVASAKVDTARALRLLDGVLAGLESMHAAGVGHLDIKPSNVILKQGDTPVLVDFGLSGRNLRPGCGTGPYGAPEVWGVVPEDHQPTPMAADIYSFCCLAFELLTSHVLVNAETEMGLITAHITHNGWPEPLRFLAQNPALVPLTQLLAKGLAADPRERPTATQMRAAMAAIGPDLESQRWPLVAKPHLAS